jgi:polar amino acid transport system substrate-binding protein
MLKFAFLHNLTMSWLLVFLCAACASSNRSNLITASPQIDFGTPVNSGHAIIRIASGEWIPYTGEDLPNYGCDSIVVSEAFALEGVQVEFGFFPWARSYYEAEIGNWDGTLEWADTPEHREKFYLSDQPTSQQEWVFFHLKGYHFDWNNLDNLVGKRVGLTSGYVYSGLFDELKLSGSVQFEEAGSDEANFRKLINGRIDVFLVERRVGYAVLERSFSAEEKAQIVAHLKAFDQFQPYVLLSRAVSDNERYIQLYNDGFEKLVSSGRYTQIMNECLTPAP